MNNDMNNQNIGQTGYNPNPVNIGMNNQNMGQTGYNPTSFNTSMNNTNNQNNKASIDKKMIRNIVIGIVAVIIAFLIIKLLLGGKKTKEVTGMSKYLPNDKYDVICENKDTSNEYLDLTLVVGLSEDKGYLTSNMAYILSTKDGEALESNEESNEYVEEYMEIVKGDKYEYIDGKIVVSKFAADASNSVSDLKNDLISQGFSCR